MRAADKPLLLVLAGPTASGKTALAVDLARILNTEIISADARQFYREIPIGTAAPGPAEQQGVPHHFVGHISLTENYNAAQFESEALKRLHALFQHHRVVIAAGGSGMYLDALCQGMDKMPALDTRIRKSVNDLYALEGINGIRRELMRLDPVYFHQVDKANPRRMMRAIEVSLCTGKPYSSYRLSQAVERPFRIERIVIDRPRHELHARIELRLRQMIQQGFIEEAVGLFRFRHLNALQTLGYREIYDWLTGRMSLSQAIEKVATHTRRYARRQLTWFRRWDDARWFDASEREKIIQFVQNL